MEFRESQRDILHLLKQTFLVKAQEYNFAVNSIHDKRSLRERTITVGYHRPDYRKITMKIGVDAMVCESNGSGETIVFPVDGAREQEDPALYFALWLRIPRWPTFPELYAKHRERLHRDQIMYALQAWGPVKNLPYDMRALIGDTVIRIPFRS
jgi:hypothetical protein